MYPSVFNVNKEIFVYKGAVIGVKLPVHFFKDGDYIIAESRDLELTGYGKTQKEALKSIEIVVQLFFEEMNQKGLSLEFVAEKGFIIEEQPSPAKRRKTSMFENLLELKDRLFHKSYPLEMSF